MSPVSCLLSYLLSVVSIRSRNNQPQVQPQQPANRSGPISRAEESQSTRCQRSRQIHTHAASVVGLSGHGYSRNSTRSGSIAHLDQSPTHRPLPPTPRLTLFPHLWSQPPFSLLFLFLSPLVTSHNQTLPHPASSTADALRCTCRQSEPSRGESRPLSARLLLSPLPLVWTAHRLLQSTSRCESVSSVRAQQQIDWPSACNNIGSTDHFRPALHHHPAVPIFTPCCCCYCRCLLLLLCCRCLD